MERTEWEDNRDYIKVLNNAYSDNDKKRFGDLLKYTGVHNFHGCNEQREEFFEIINKGCNKFKIGAK